MRKNPIVEEQENALLKDLIEFLNEKKVSEDIRAGAFSRALMAIIMTHENPYEALGAIVMHLSLNVNEAVCQQKFRK